MACNRLHNGFTWSAEEEVQKRKCRSESAEQEMQKRKPGVKIVDIFTFRSIDFSDNKTVNSNNCYRMNFVQYSILFKSSPP